jgi:hypothetical protein
MSHNKEPNSKTLNYERKMKDGKQNLKYVDVLEEDKPIACQKFVCVSFISPEKIIKQKEMFYFKEFLNKWDFTNSMNKFVQFLNFMSYKYKLKFEDLTSDFKEFVNEERLNVINSTIEDDYKTFIDNNEEELENTFGAKHQFKTSTRGLKIRGVYPSIEEAELRCKMLREIDPNHDVFVGPVGLWMPWDPEAYKTGRVEYMEEELNQLMHEKNKNEIHAKNAFEQRTKDIKQKAIEENIKNAEKSGNKLTQTVDESGNLVGINNYNTQENSLKEQDVIMSSDIKTELFEGDNIITGKSDNGKSALINNPFV